MHQVHPTQESHHRRHRRHHTPMAYRLCDGLTELVIYGAIVFGPWAFGTTQPWAVRVMNYTTYSLGALLLFKWIIRWLTGYQPARWSAMPAGEDNPSSFDSGIDPQRRVGPACRTSLGAGRGPGLQTDAGLAPSLLAGGRQTPHGQIDDPEPAESRSDPPPTGASWPTRVLAVLTVLILGYCLVSVLNARANYLPFELRFDYFDNYIPWLPHSYDRDAGWFAFWQYLGLACLFWASRDWLLGQSRRERRSRRSEDRESRVDGSKGIEGGGAEELLRLASKGSPVSPGRPPDPTSGRMPHLIPARLQRMLWILCLNGTVLGVESIVQRLSKTDKLLWHVRPRFNTRCLGQFGPYAYRSNAAQYFNLVWPVSLGLWWALRRSHYSNPRARPLRGGGAHVLALPCTMLMAACPAISSSRGGALVSGAGILAAVGILYMAEGRSRHRIRLPLMATLAVVSGLIFWLGWTQLQPRLEQISSGPGTMSGRTIIYENARQMARDYPLYGTGPGSFAHLYQLYQPGMGKWWAAQVHDDWLETRITFGWVGFGMILVALIMVPMHLWRGSGTPVPWPFAALLGVSLGGCLLHARFDFPLQIHSILALFLLLCSVALSIRTAKATG